MTDRDPQPNALPQQTMLQEYRIESVLGAGGFGMTYLARDTNLDKPVAIKEYLPDDLALRALDGSVVPVNTESEYNYKWGLERFLVEARTLARFSHPHIVRVSRYFEANGTGYMVMDYEQGESLSQLLRRTPQPVEPRLRAMMAPLLDGLQAVHAAGFLHLDIKPGNIYVRADGTPVLLDFGAARQAIGDVTQNIASVLTPGYAPPELHVRNGRQGPWSDIYALAGVLYRAVTGEHPPDAKSRLKSDGVEKKLAAVRARYGGPFISAIGWGLALDDRRRPQSVADWRGAVLRETRPGRDAASEGGSSGKLLWMALGVLAFFVFVEGAGLLRPSSERAAKKVASAPETGPPGRDINDDFRSADTDASGGLSREEMAQHLPQLAARFDEIDANHDGRVSLDELQGYWRRQPSGAPAGESATAPQPAAAVPVPGQAELGK